jgi:S1-C subfamily serine protease
MLAHFKLEFDPTTDRMTWTKLDFTPPAPQSLGPKGSGPEGLDNLGKFMKAFATLLGIKGAPEPALRGFLGVQLAEKEKAVVVQSVLAQSPAATAGVRTGDRVLTVDGTPVATPADIMTLLAKVSPGQQVSVVVERGQGKHEISIIAGEGI